MAGLGEAKQIPVYKNLTLQVDYKKEFPIFSGFKYSMWWNTYYYCYKITPVCFYSVII